MKASDVGIVDLFCGAGGLTYGLEMAGLRVSEGIDVDPNCRHPYEANTRSRFVLRSVLDYDADDLARAWSRASARVLVGCAPCQPFSTYTQGIRSRPGERWVLLKRFAELIEEAVPEIVSMENVEPLQRTGTFRRFLERLREIGYEVSHEIAECQMYGVPQMRRRLVMLASRCGPIELARPTHPTAHEWPTVSDAIRGLEPLEAGGVSSYDPLHRASRLSAVNLRRIRASRPGGTWKDWPDELVASCHKRISGKKYSGVYGRMEWERPAPTITGQSFGFGSGRFGHPDQDRGLSLREAAILQSFPKNYSFVAEGVTPMMKSVGRMIGNAVPPQLGRAIGLTIREHLSVL